MVVAAHYLPLLTRNAEDFKKLDPFGFAHFAYTGVDLFFVITGYVFTRQLFDGPGNVWAYALRRLFRIYPLYLVALIAYAAVKVVTGGQLQHLGLHLVFLHTFASREIAFYYNPAFWSLPPEIEFYMALPLLAVLVRQKYGFVCLVIAAATLRVLMGVFTIPGSSVVTAPVLMSVHLPGLLIEFFIGFMAWLAVRKVESLWLAMSLLIVGVACWLMLANQQINVLGSGKLQPSWAYVAERFPNLLAALCFGCVLVASIRLLRHMCGWPARWVVWAGNLTFGVYLFHNALPLLLEPLRPALGGWGFIGLCFALTLVTAWVMHQLIEKPAKAFGRDLASRVASR